MKLPTFGAAGAVFWGGLAAGILDLGAVLAFWAAHGAMPEGILRAIASAVLGPAAFEGGAFAPLLGLLLHFGVSFAFAAAYVAAALRATILRSRFVLAGLAWGIVAYVVMTFVVVPLSRADFGPWPPPALNLAASLFIHLVLFGVPIAWAASRLRR